MPESPASLPSRLPGVPDAPRSDELPLLEALSADLAAAGYTHDGVAGLLGDEANAALHRDQPVPARLVIARALAADPVPAVAVATALWLLGDDVAAGHVDAALPRTGVVGLLALGLVEDAPARGSVRAAVDLRPHASDADAELWVASDLGALHRPGVLRGDHVLGIGGASLTLAQATVRRPVERALDLGTGCGIQTFHLLAHARHVVATDLSWRALAFTRFNLLLNHEALGLDPRRLEDRVELRQGSLLEPVAGEEFDLVVSNPPFVITPRAPGGSEEERFTYRDGGLAGDALVSGLIEALPGVLTPGGTAQLLANWEIQDGPEGGEGDGAGGAGDWSARPRTWIRPGTEAWFIQREVQSPAEYAETWLRDAAEARDPARYAERYAQYLADFASRGVGGIGFGMVWLRRPADPAVAPVGARFEAIGYPIEQPIGPHLALEVDAADSLAGRDLAPLRFEVAEDVTEERHQRPGAEHPGVILLRQGAGLRRTTLLSSEEAGLVSACDGELTAGQIAHALAALLGEDAAELVPRLLDSVDRLVTTGFLSEIRNKG
ncbi:DUF7059 domain-containing protein [Zafaria sp. Z1313]|uniref:DUF7059 domain-containing protein n=1 Tax=Zafaria sp. Z1313 TaxID=3423202 RepID=UPI003D30329B